MRKVNMPSMTLPKTTCLPSRKSHGAVVMKNCTSRDKPGEDKSMRVDRSSPGIRSCWHQSLPVSTKVVRHNESGAYRTDLCTIDNSPGPVCFTSKFSSWNWPPRQVYCGVLRKNKRMTDWELVSVYRKRPGSIAFEKITTCEMEMK